MKSILDLWHKVDGVIQACERLLIVLGLAIILGAGMLNIILRLSGLNEIVFTGVLLKQLTLWLGLLGASLATASTEHLNVDAFGRLLKDKGAQVNNLVIGIICVLFSIFLAYLSFAFFSFQSKQMQSAIVGGGSFAWIWVVVFPVSFTLMAVRYFFQTIEHGGVLFSPDLVDITSDEAEVEAEERDATTGASSSEGADT